MTSQCSDHQKRIQRLFLGELTVEEQQALERHLAECLQCRSEKESYAQTLRLLKSAGDEPVPRHFFVYAQEPGSNPWQIFCQMKPLWQAVTIAAVAMFLFMGIAAVSRIQMRSDPGGWAISFGGSIIDIDSLKEDILQTAYERNNEASIAQIQEVRAELARSFMELRQQQQADLITALTRLDNNFNERITMAEGNVRADTQTLAVGLYQTISQQRAQDLSIINLRFDSIEANNAIKAQRTDTILGTLLEVAELRLR